MTGNEVETLSLALVYLPRMLALVAGLLLVWWAAGWGYRTRTRTRTRRKK